MKLWMKILLGLALGVGFGLYMSTDMVKYFEVVVSMFINSINMLVVPLVFSSITVGITSINDPKKLGRVGMKALLLYMVTTIIAIVIGLFFAKIINPGSGLSMDVTFTESISSTSHLSKIFLDLIPKNPIYSLANENVLQIIVFSIFLGLSINLAGKRAKPVLNFLESVADIMYKMTSIVMKFAPYGVFAIMSCITSKYGWEVIKPLFSFLICNYLACIVNTVLVFGFILLVLARLNPVNFFKGMMDAIAFAFTTNSSSATLPVSMHCVQENLGVSKNISNFVMPLGATVNMNGSAIFQAIAALFIAQAYGINLDLKSILTIVITATISAVGSAGIPGSGYVMMSLVLSSVGLPLEGMTILMGVDRIREMVSTVVNVLGDAVVAVFIAKTEGELDEEQYHHATIIGIEESDV